ncbi:LysR family transcriptional regulator [Bosea sp. 685]|uniref:LysR family transcriptional regulator n=1 Tax=Bosea sp. 685 TaxID=3080057 RepID=UPI002892F33D|nr:LysR family transcriptional regulator [Bosea sp. 685]WNJ93608.1 LysR family transcriptional regulator [Bosea sp. 685]
MQITLKQIETFVRLASLRNFRRVAEQMNTTQPNISARISALERVLNQRLFERDAGSVVLTDQGQALLPLAAKALEATEALLQAGDTTSRQSVMRLGVAETVAQTWLHRFLREMAVRFPDVVVELSVDLTFNLQRNLIDGSLDIAFLNGPVSDLSVANLPLGTVALPWVAAPRFAAALPDLAGADDLARFPILTHARNTRPYAEVVDYFKRNSSRLSRPVSSSNLAACLNMTLDGLGIATLPSPLVERFLESGELVALNCDWVPTPMNFTASYVTMPARPIIEAAANLATEVVDWKPNAA